MKRFAFFALILLSMFLLLSAGINYFFPTPSFMPGGRDELKLYEKAPDYKANSLLLRSPERAFNSISAKQLKYSTVSFDEDLIAKMPPGGHLQGVQVYLHDGKKYMYLSHDSSDTHPYLIIAEQKKEYLWEARRVLLIDYDTTIFGDSLRHVGGIQVCDNYLVAGLEDNIGKKNSLIVFYDISEPLNPLKLPNLTIKRSSETEKEKTAGAVGIISYSRDNIDGYLLVVANWDSNELDFYFITGDLRELNSEGSVGYEATPFFTWQSREREDADWFPDGGWGSYQSVNFVKDYSGNLYLFCTASSGKIIGRDIIDFFRVQINSEDNSVSLTKKDKKILDTGLYNPLSRKAHLIYGGGVLVRDDETMVLLATAGYIRGNTLRIVVSGP